jgi:hypothetical protein
MDQIESRLAPLVGGAEPHNPSIQADAPVSKAFLALVLPTEGYKCAVVLDGDRRRQKFFKTTDELANYILQQDGLGRTVYHACAVFKTPDNRKSVNALGSKTLLADVDVGDGPNKYATIGEAIAALGAFCKAIAWPRPTVVYSGSGLHVYWALTKMLDPVTWRAYARILKHLCVQHGFKADPARTADISSILRTPGTHNRKHGGEIEVRLLVEDGPYDVKQLNGLSDISPTRIVSNEIKASHLTAAAIFLYGEPDADPERIANQCPIIGALRTDPGRFREPTIYATIGVLQHCAEGNQGRHWFDAEYVDEVELKFEQHTSAGIGPTTCAHFATLEPDICKTCPHNGKITSPIQLGRQSANGQAANSDRPQPRTTSGDAALDAEIARLAKLPPFIYEQERKTVAAHFEVRTHILDRLVNAAQHGGEDHRQGQTLDLPNPQPWPDVVDGDALLFGISALLTRYVVMSRAAADATALWIVHTYLIDVADATPRLAVKSPEKRCGKTTLLTIISHLAIRTLATSNISAAALFRTIEASKPTLVIDEADTFIGMSEELRGIINSGHTRGTAFVVRTDGEDFQPRRFSTWAPIAFATIGKLPGTVEDRSIAIPLRRRRPDEKVERLRRDHSHFHQVASRVARWAVDHAVEIAETDPEIPEQLHDRAADNWRPLLAIADHAGGDWPARARSVAVKLSTEGAADQDSVRTMLLADIRAAFQLKGTDRLSSDGLVAHLISLDERPWPELSKGKPITKNGLARLLRPFGISSGTIRVAAEGTVKGYYLSTFADAFARYLPSESVTP